MENMEDSLNLTLQQVIPIIQNRIMTQSRYFGIQAWKSPLDFWVYQEVLWELKPDVIIEIGNHRGGSTLALAHLCDALGSGRIVGVDISHAEVAESVRSHPRICLVEGDACAVFNRVAALIRPEESVLVIEDSSHTFDNTLRILQTYAPLIQPGGYFIVEDGICNHGLQGGPFPGPYEAVEQFVNNHPAFVIDRSREAFLLTWNPKGYLLRVASSPPAGGTP
jgi:cephalosporin hydroxylase